MYKASLDGQRILVVEDDADTRSLLSVVFGIHGAHVVEASTTREGLAAVEQLRPDGLICDIGLPDEDGYSFMRKVRALEGSSERHIPAIALTGYSADRAVSASTEAGFNAHVVKPCDPEDLVHILARLSGWRGPSPSV